METEVAAVLAKILDDGADVHRCAAAQALARFPVSLRGAPLKAALLDQDPDVRFDVVEALGSDDAGAYAEALLQTLADDPDGKVKAAAIAALWRLGYRPVAPILRKLAISRAEDDIAWDDSGFFEDGWDDWLDIQLAAIEGLGALGDADAVLAITTALDDEAGQDVSETAIPALMKLGAPGIDALKRRFIDGNTRFRRRVAQALKDHGAALDSPLVTLCLGDREAEVRLRALSALSTFSPGDARLLPLLEDSDAAVRAAALGALGGFRPDVVRTALSDPSATVR